MTKFFKRKTSNKIFDQNTDQEMFSFWGNDIFTKKQALQSRAERGWRIRESKE